MAVTLDESLRGLVLGCARRRGWSTQRHIAVACGLDESAFSRFLDGRQEIGAVATFELFREVGIPVEHYPTAFDLLERAQREAQESVTARASQSAGRRDAAAQHRRRVQAAPAHAPPVPPPPEPDGDGSTFPTGVWIVLGVLAAFSRPAETWRLGVPLPPPAGVRPTAMPVASVRCAAGGAPRLRMGSGAGAHGLRRAHRGSRGRDGHAAPRWR